MQNNETISLNEVLAQNAEHILDQVLTVLSKAEGTTYSEMPTEVLQARIQHLFDTFWQSISQNNTRPFYNYIWSTSRARGNEGFSVSDLQSVGLCLRDVILDVVDQAYTDDPTLRLHHSRRIEELILSGIGAGVRGFVDGRESLITRQYQALQRSQPPEKHNSQA
jgi:hypothetical protein